jgi:hypothetical protein
MYLKIMISLSFAALAVALFVTPNASYQVLLQFLVCASAVLIVWNAVRDQAPHLWAVAFCGIAIVFNPILPVALPTRAFFVLDLLCMALFLVYARTYKAKPRWSMASVSATERSLGPSALGSDVDRT